MSKYGIFKNKKDETLVFYPCPKNGNSSVKLFLAKHLNIDDNFSFISDEVPRYKQKNDDFKGKKNLVNFLPTKQPFEKINVDKKCCIIREPVSRFVSSFKNRVLYHKDIEFLNHSIDMILAKLENNKFENLHFLPQTFFLGNDLKYYDFYCNIEKIALFEDYINDFFDKKIKFPKIQTGGKDKEITLSNDQVKRIKLIYSSDYKLMNKN